MNFNQYTRLTKRTDNNDTVEKRIENYTISLFEEVGEVASVLKKAWYHNHTLDIDELRKELGDVFWYLSRLFDLLSFDIEAVKLKQINRKEDQLKLLMIETGFFIFAPEQDALNRVYWTLRSLIEEFDISVSSILEMNINKLKKRYPEKYTHAGSVMRVDTNK